MKPLYFIHIPKTAGTSFRNAAMKYFGKKEIVSDYNPHAPETSDVVREYTYEKRDYWPLYQHLNKTNKKMLCGHFPANRYMPGMGVENVVIFFREPIQRIVSEFRHFVRHQKYRGSFSDFYNQPRNINFLSKWTEGVPVEAVGVVGLTERYNDSLRTINARYELELEVLLDNAGRESIEEPYEISEEDFRTLSQLNNKDIDLYRKTLELFEQRQSMAIEGLPYAHVRLTSVKPNKVIGWAWWAVDADEAVEIDIRINGEVVAQAPGRIYSPSLFRLAPPRGGHVEFAAAIDAKPGDAVDCVVHRTGQVFPSRPMIVE